MCHATISKAQAEVRRGNAWQCLRACVRACVHMCVCIPNVCIRHACTAFANSAWWTFFAVMWFRDIGCPPSLHTHTSRHCLECAGGLAPLRRFWALLAGVLAARARFLIPSEYTDANMPMPQVTAERVHRREHSEWAYPSQHPNGPTPRNIRL